RRYGRPLGLNVEVADAPGVSLDEALARRHALTHQHVKHPGRPNGVFYVDLEHGAGGRVHGGFPELVRVHLAETLVALDMHALPAVLLLQFGYVLVALLIAVAPEGVAAAGNSKQRRLGDVQMPR